MKKTNGNPMDGETEEVATEKIQALLSSLVGKTVTKAEFSEEEGYRIEIGPSFCMRSCSAHTLLLTRTIQ
jgi:hypothetical protein